jgi:hypothetical protein
MDSTRKVKTPKQDIGLKEDFELELERECCKSACDD